MKEWIIEEVKAAEFADKRLNKRMKILLDRLSSKPVESIPTACRSWKETIAAYRFFQNDSVSDKTVLRPHSDATIERISAHDVVLIVQDTTELDYTGKNDISGLGYLTYENRIGAFLHASIALTPDRVCLGSVDAKIWSRPLEEMGRKKLRKQIPIEEKESYRWLEGYRRSAEIAGQLTDTMIVNIADREGDIYEIYEEASDESNKAEWIIRCNQDRSLEEDISTKDVKNTKIRESLENSEILGTMGFELPRSHERKDKHVEMTVQAKRVRLHPPFRKGKKLKSVEINAVLIKEKNPPSDDEAIEWLLLSSLPMSTLSRRDVYDRRSQYNNRLVCLPLANRDIF